MLLASDAVPCRGQASVSEATAERLALVDAKSPRNEAEICSTIVNGRAQPISAALKA